MQKHRHTLILYRFCTKNPLYAIKIFKNILKDILKEKIETAGHDSFYLNDCVYIKTYQQSNEQYCEKYVCIEVYISKDINKNMRLLITNIIKIIAKLSNFA